MMRGIAALSVIFAHIGMIGKGSFGVDLFFCISGFIMMFVTEKSSDGFLKKRVLRICPLYYLLTILAFAVAFIIPNLLRDANTELVALLRSFLFIGSAENNKIIVGVGWTLCYEMFFYLLFFIALKISHKYRHIISTVFLTIIVFTGLIIKPSNEYLLFYTRPILLEFALGMFAYKILYWRNSKNINILLPLAIIIYISLFFVRLQIDRLFTAGIPTFVFFILTLKALQDKKIPKFFVVLGNISYSLYLTHTFVITSFSRLIMDIDHKVTASSIIASVFAISIAIGVAYISWYLVENKLTNWIKTKII